MILKTVLVALLGVILYCLGSALVFMLKARARPDRMVKALTWRIGLSLVLFFLLLVAYGMGWITPHGV